MIRLKLSNKSANEGVVLDLPATPAEVSEAFSWFERIGVEPSDVRIAGVNSPVPTLGQYILRADIHDPAEMKKLNELAEAIEQMDDREWDIFAGALDAESINGLDDVLKISKRLGNYIILPNVKTDTELGRILVDTGYKNFPEAVQPYLDYRAIGAEYYAENGGAYGPGGYVRRKSSLEQAPEQRDALITLYLLTPRVTETMADPYRLTLPAMDEELEQAKEQIGVDHFTEATIVKVEFGKPYLAELIPQECICVEDANELALGIEEMQQRDGELLKYLAVLSVEQMETLTDALRVAVNLDDYERITEGTYEYGQSVLRRIGADDELIDTIDGYMDFEKFGEDSMVEDGVRQTEFGLIRRCIHPFPEETQTMQMGGM